LIEDGASKAKERKMKVANVALMSASLVLSAILPSSGQEDTNAVPSNPGTVTIQNLTINLTVYNQATATRVSRIRLTNKDFVRLVTGSNLAGANLFFVMPVDSGGLTNVGNLGAFVRVTTRRPGTIFDVTTPDQFNFFQDAVATDFGANNTTAFGINRFSIAVPTFAAELQGGNTITTQNTRSIFTRGNRLAIRNRPTPVTVPAFGSFSTTVNGTGTIPDVTTAGVPIIGTMSAGFPSVQTIQVPTVATSTTSF
jgi:hypothetical protein